MSSNANVVLTLLAVFTAVCFDQISRHLLRRHNKADAAGILGVALVVLTLTYALIRFGPL